jgi:hypothetical protein
LDINVNQISSLDISQNTALTRLLCNANGFTNIDISSNINLVEVYCLYNNLITVNTSNNVNLEKLNCSFNPLTSLDLSNNINLFLLEATNNQLTEIDLSANTNLDELWLNGNQITNLDFSSNTLLKLVVCANMNSLSGILNLSENTILEQLLCNNTSISGLNLRNGNNTLLYINALECPNLVCVDVDDVDYANANWSGNFDADVVFSLDCSNGISEIKEKLIEVYPNPTTGLLTVKNLNPSEIKIFDNTGRLLNSFSNTNSFDISDYSAGIYFIQIQTKTEVIFEKLIKK